MSINTLLVVPAELGKFKKQPEHLRMPRFFSGKGRSFAHPRVRSALKLFDGTPIIECRAGADPPVPRLQTGRPPARLDSTPCALP